MHGKLVKTIVPRWRIGTELRMLIAQQGAKMIKPKLGHVYIIPTCHLVTKKKVVYSLKVFRTLVWSMSITVHSVTINKICKKIRLKTKFQVLLGQRPCPGFRNGSGFESQVNIEPKPDFEQKFGHLSCCAKSLCDPNDKISLLLFTVECLLSIFKR